MNQQQDRCDRAYLLAEQGRYELALREIQAYLANAPQDVRAYTLMSYCHHNQEQHEQAIATAQQAINLDPEAAFCHYALARAYYGAAQLRRAYQSIEEALSIDPNDADYHALIALILYTRKQYPTALKACRSGLHLEPDHRSCQNLQIMALIQLNALQEAEEIAATALAQAPDTSFPHAAKGWIALHHGQAAIAQDAFREALRIDPDWDWPRRGMVEALKARSLWYRWILQYDLRMSKLGHSEWLAFASILLLFPPLRFLMVLIRLVAGALRQFSVFFLRFDNDGRLLLTHKEIRANNLMMGLFATVALGGVVAAVSGNGLWLLLSLLGAIAVYCGFRVGQAETWDDRITFGLGSGIVGCAGVGFAIAMSPLSSQIKEHLIGIVAGIAALGFLGFLLAIVGTFCYRSAQFLWLRFRG